MANVKFVSASRVYAKGAPPAVDALDLDVKDGEFMVLVGPSGSGKTTALRMLAGLEPLDGGRVEIGEVILPVISPGLVSTALICVIFAWNELFLALNLTVTNAATMPMFLISSVPQEGLYLAHLSAAATVASVPVILVGWIAQRSLVRGLSMGAIK